MGGDGHSPAAALSLGLVLLIVLLVKGCSGSDPLTGTWDYDSNTLTLTDGEGTIGGTYELHRQEE